MMFILGDLFAYSLEAGIFLIVTYIGWRFLLYGTTFHRFNRKVLLLSIFISMLLPFLISLIPENPFPAEVEIGSLTSLVIDSPAIQTEETNNVFEKYWREILVSVYALGLAGVALWILISNIRLISIIKKSHNLDDDYPYIKISDEIVGAFSWGGLIILSTRDIDENLQRVIQHEQIHISRKHWVDLLLIQLILIIEWYNPAVWLILHRVKMNHEFEVDSAIPSADKYEYSLMLLQKSTYKNHFGITDGLNSNLKIRLKMINKQNSSPLRRWVAVLILPLIALTSYGVSRPQTERVINSVKPVATLSEVVSTHKIADKNKAGNDNKDVLKSAVENADSIIVVGVGKSLDPELEAMLSGKNEGAKPAVFVDGVRYTKGIETIDKSEIESITVRKDMPEFPNGAIYVVTKKILHLSKSNAAIFVDGVRFTKEDLNILDPSKIKSVSVVKECSEFPDGVVYIVMKKDESNNNNAAVFVDGVRYSGSINSIDKSNIERIVVIKDDPEFPEGVYYVLTKKNDSKNISSEYVNDDEKIEIHHVSTIKKAKFPGGVEALENWLKKNMEYPAAALTSGIQGRVVVQAFVGSDGKISNARLLQGVESSLNNEALRLVGLMPAWLPAEHQGKPVNSEVDIPIIFKLPN